MIEDGYLSAGYEYVIIDDCWSAPERTSDGKLQADPERFPNGIKALADHVHNLGLKLGIYGDYGEFTCQGYPGSIDHLELDAKTFAEWKVDYLKLDGCYADSENMEEGYGEMSKYLNRTGRPIVFSCSFPAYKELEANYTAAVEYCNLWRNYWDIDDAWDDVKIIADWFSENQDFLLQFAGPGHWNDPDMVVLHKYTGWFCRSGQIWGVYTRIHFCPTNNWRFRTQMTIWALLAAPLIMSVDLRTIEPEYKEILLNKDAIAINQDPLGIQGRHVTNDSEINIWTKPLSSDDQEHRSLAIGFVSYRTDGYPYQYEFQLSNFDIDESLSYKIKVSYN
ncbi:hypothetical protein NQ318_001053 [Aromia moschata]|uniref:Alpha-galactosidase n=1 Tax=Aromia moschata TaxID=1265417 RepID=A0AAV8ZDV0_9CUCU|nr:hypothetical protein NQ318_001053 [Aromia moschata]